MEFEAQFAVARRRKKGTIERDDRKGRKKAVKHRDVKRRGGQVTLFESACGGLPSPEAANNPWKYKFSWSPRGALAASRLPARYLQDGRLEMGHARALLGLSGSEQASAARAVVAKGMSVRQTEALVRKLISQRDKPPPTPRSLDPNIRQLQDELASKLGAKVKIQHGAKGKGKLVLSYNSLDELDGILSHIK